MCVPFDCNNIKKLKGRKQIKINNLLFADTLLVLCGVGLVFQ